MKPTFPKNNERNIRSQEKTQQNISSIFLFFGCSALQDSAISIKTENELVRRRLAVWRLPAPELQEAGGMPTMRLSQVRRSRRVVPPRMILSAVVAEDTDQRQAFLQGGKPATGFAIDMDVECTTMPAGQNATNARHQGIKVLQFKGRKTSRTPFDFSTKCHILALIFPGKKTNKCIFVLVVI
ncbi:hypothetical protein NL676_035592 [Syzygium grande]|nr:hypothetical protein NL676_035592 [Syzygium grande]